MVNANASNTRFEFVSSLLGLSVRGKTRRLGPFTDVLAKRTLPYPEIEGLVVRRGRRDFVVPYDSLAGLFEGTRSLEPIDEQTLAELVVDKEHFLLREVVLDNQIVDVQGAKVHRVNDVQLLTSSGKTFMVNVDIGTTGLLRRLGFERTISAVAGLLGKSIDHEMISWKYVQTLEESRGPDPIHLAVEHRELSELHPGELADILEDLNQYERLALLRSVGTEASADVLEEVPPELGADIIEGMDPAAAADIIEEMEPAAAADILNEVDEDQRALISSHIGREEREEIEQLQQYEESSAGGLMSPNFLSAHPNATVADAFDLVRQEASQVEIIHYIHLLDEGGKLTGVVGLRKLLLSQSTARLGDLVSTRLVSVHPDTSFAEVAEVFYRFNFGAVPVTDANGVMLGIVSYKHSFDELLPFYMKEANA